jgi:hypothetical protein
MFPFGETGQEKHPPYSTCALARQVGKIPPPVADLSKPGVPSVRKPVARMLDFGLIAR